MKMEMKDSLQAKEVVRNLFSSQALAVLATQDQGVPYGSVVAFAVTNDLKHLLFATSRATRKYSNLTRNPSAALVIDNRTNQEADFHRAIAVTATGIVREVESDEKKHLLELYLSRHPYLEDFVTSPTCALLKVEVDTYYVVSGFQNIMELAIKK